MMDNAARITKIHELLSAALMPSALEIIDDSHQHVGHAGSASGAGHFTVRIGSEAFAGKPMIQQHRLVYAALESMIPDEIHALAIDILPASV